MTVRAPGRLVLLPLGIATLLISIAGGVARFGIDLGASQPAISTHGALAVFGFFGMLVSLERGVVLRHAWVVAGPICALAGSVLVLADLPDPCAAAAWAAAAILTFLIILGIGRAGSGPTLAHEQMLGGCVAWAVAAVLWGAGAALGVLVPFLAAFLLLTIVGERTQLGKLAYRSSTRRVGRLLMALLGAGLVVTLVDADIGSRVVGIVFVGYGAWLLRVDARSRISRPGLLRYMRRTVIGGLVWLVLSGLLWVQQGELGTGAGSDAAIHAFFMGFVMSMVFAHAPMVFAAVTRIRVPYYRALAIPLVILYVGLVVRIVGDLGVDRALAKWGAVVTGAAVVLYIAFVVASAVAALAGYAPARPKRQGPVPK